MRKKAQERRRSSPPVSTSSSSTSNLSSSLSDPPSEAGVEKPELDGVGEGTSSMTGFEENEEGLKDYPMDQLWNEIDTSDLISDLSFEGHKDDEAGNVLCPSMPSPMWDYCPDSLWKIDDDEFKLLAPMGDTTIRES